MKNYYFTIILSFFAYILQAQIVNIPDANFKNALVNTLCVDTDGNGVGDSDADTNDDGEIQVSEAEAVLWLNVSNNNILSLTGIESFINLLTLWCYNNSLTSLDFTQNQNLEWLRCDDNSLTSLDVTQNQNLRKLWFTHNQLTSINVTQNPNLVDMLGYDNQLTSLDVTQNPNLEKLSCYLNQITALDVSQCPNLYWLHLGGNQLTTLDVSQNPNITTLYVESNLLNSLNIKNGNNFNMEDFRSIGNPNLQCIEVDDPEFSNNQTCSGDGWCKDSWSSYSEDCSLGVQELDTQNIALYPNPAIDIIVVDSQEPIQSIKIYNINGGLIIQQMNDYDNLDISKLKSGLYLVQIEISHKYFFKKLNKK